MTDLQTPAVTRPRIRVKNAAKSFSGRVVVDVDAVFAGDDAWYEQVARSRPPKDAPWYHVLVSDASHSTYVAERNLELDDSHEPVRHPLLQRFFGGFSGGRYHAHQSMN